MESTYETMIVDVTFEDDPNDPLVNNLKNNDSGTETTDTNKLLKMPSSPSFSYNNNDNNVTDVRNFNTPIASLPLSQSSNWDSPAPINTESYVFTKNVNDFHRKPEDMIISTPSLIPADLSYEMSKWIIIHKLVTPTSK